ncbi:ATP-binding protein [Actinomyces culturomici]|uniref:ATP-binding protein n=1 Tax=Actinomyces culturomici TaxID=1926276 RepID=UPI000E1FEC66|nr:ATP-binding protein [Actinomyces culturomici]
MDPLRNPYTPNAGAAPEVVVGRTDQLAAFDLLLARLKRGRSEQSMLITGLRGVGKTVLLGQFRKKALSSQWVVIELEVSKHDDTAFRREIAARVRTALLELSPRAKWNDRLRHAAAVLKSFHLTMDPEGNLTAGLDIDAAEGYGDHGDIAMDLTDLLTALGEAAADRERGVVLLFDEVQFLDRGQLEALITALHKIVQRELPVTLVGAGLPQLAELAGDAKSYAERLFTFPSIGNLSEGDARDALRLPAEAEDAGFTNEALDRAVDITGGYPYFLQELGYAVWPLAEGPIIGLSDIDDALPGYQEKLDQSFFRVRLDRTTELQSAYLRAMAELGPGPQRSQDVAHLLGRTSPQIAPTRAELINMGLLYTPEHGSAAFTVPHFDEYMRRAFPELRVPPLRSRKKSAS